MALLLCLISLGLLGWLCMPQVLLRLVAALPFRVFGSLWEYDAYAFSLLAISAVLQIVALVRCGRPREAGLRFAVRVSGGVYVWLLAVVAVSVFCMLEPVTVPVHLVERVVRCGNPCINNLRQIDGAKWQWPMATGETNMEVVPTSADLDPYLKGGFAKYWCPEGGSYEIRALGTDPVCIGAMPPHKRALTVFVWEQRGAPPGAHRLQ